MSYMTINNRRVTFTNERNVLSVIRKSGIDLPTFCYHSELSTYGACRMCVVEDDRGRVFASCSEVPRDGMVIYTNTPRLQHHRKMIIELLLAAHCRDCTTCAKNGVCTLQKLSRQLGITEVRFETVKLDKSLIDKLDSNPISRMLVRDLVEICRACDMTCVAEGVETPEDEQLVRSIGCDVGQGYLYSRPLAAGDFDERYMAGS